MRLFIGSISNKRSGGVVGKQRERNAQRRSDYSKQVHAMRQGSMMASDGV